MFQKLFVLNQNIDLSNQIAFRQTSDFTSLMATNNRWQSHHLYVCYSNSLALKNHILFRDTLRKDKNLIQKYSELKKSLTDNLKILSAEYTTTTPDCEIVSSRIFKASGELVFRAWSDPNHLKNWWGPSGFTNTFKEFDFRVGGKWSFIMHGPDKGNYPNLKKCLMTRQSLFLKCFLTQPMSAEK